MCGIAGFINNSNQSFAADISLLEKMQKSMEHRGPDGYRIWISPDKQIGLAHRRLSIVDLSPAGFQPMHDDNNEIFVCCNGEIYNHSILRLQLEKHGYCFKSHSDTETILYAYKQWGISMLERLEGDFAIVIIDLAQKVNYLIRDRIGVKPLYFSLQGGMVTFASEIKAFWPLPWLKREINQTAFYHYLTYLATPAPSTLYKGIYKLPAGFYAKIKAGCEITFHEWYDPLVAARNNATVIDYSDETACKEQILLLLRNAVQKRLMSDVPLGAFLSGGIDSSLIVALMSEFSNNVKTFNVSFADGPEYSEIEWARTVAKKFGTDHHEIVITEKEAFNFFQKMVYHQDEPLADCVCIPLYYVSKLLKDSGVTVSLVGEGSDELFCGYSSYADYINVYNNYWKNSQQFIPASARQGLYILAKHLFPQKINRLAHLENWANGKNLFWSGAIAFSEPWKKNIFLGTHQEPYDPVIAQIYPDLTQIRDSYSLVDHHLKQAKNYGYNDFLTSMTYLEFKQRLPELLLMRVDKMTMATSVEGRVPFLDHAFVECAFNVSSNLKYKNGITKYILKKVAEDLLPHDVVHRKKMGFAAPTMRWFKEGKYFKPYFNQLLQDKKKEWSDYIDFDQVARMMKKNEEKSTEYSVQLWALQNVLACEIV